MQFTYSVLMDFLPRFLIAGIVTYLFISAFSRLSLLTYERPKFILVHDTWISGYPARSRKSNSGGVNRTGTVSTHGPDGSRTQKITLFSGKDDFKSQGGILQDLQMILLGADIWLLLSIALSPFSTVSSLLPSFPWIHSIVLYSVLSGSLLIALTGTVVCRVRVSTGILAMIMAAASAAVVIFYFLPSMAWLNSYTPFFRIVVVYSTVITVCVAVYLLAVRVRRRTAFYVSAYSTIAVYLLSAFLLALNLFTTLVK